MFFVINENICSESGSYDVSVNSVFASYNDAMLYCNYKNFWNEQGDGSNVHQYFIVSEFTFINGIYTLPKTSYTDENRHLINACYDKTECNFDTYALIYDVNDDNIINVQMNTIAEVTPLNIFKNVRLTSIKPFLY